ncbi:MAG: sigma 54-interacting transcriptional regulator [Bilophila wadsworthia]
MGKARFIDFRLRGTNQDLEALVEKKRFRSDLFFRLNVLRYGFRPCGNGARRSCRCA